MVITYKYYEYRNVELKDPRYLSQLFKERTGVDIVITVYPSERRIMVNSPKELSVAEKIELDALIALNPEPVAVYEYVTIDEGDVEAAVGKKPVMVEWFGERSVRVYFDSTLTPDQEARLRVLLDGTRMKLKRVK